MHYAVVGCEVVLAVRRSEQKMYSIFHLLTKLY